MTTDLDTPRTPPPGEPPADARTAEAPGGAPGKPLSEAAKRALLEAEDRRRVALAQASLTSTAQQEEGGRDGPEPTRFGDWELKGMAIDF